MPKNYNHLRLEQRYQIEVLLTSGHTQKFIAEAIGVSRSTISRELRRNTPAGGVGYGLYWALNAQRRTDIRHQQKPKLLLFTEAQKRICRTWLEIEKFSPVLISVEGKRVFGSFVSGETIYKWIWACKFSNRLQDRQDRNLYLKLRHGRKRHKRGNRHDKRGNIPGRVGIDQRPPVVGRRKRVGDLEVDLMIGPRHRSAILVSLDRASLKVKLRKLLSKESKVVKQVLLRAYEREQPWLRTITFDNDSAFTLHEQIAKALNVDTYFTRPYTSQDKGSVENRIGILRRFLPKWKDLDEVSHAQLRKIENQLNNRPVKKFKYKTPNQIFLEKVALIS